MAAPQGDRQNRAGSAPTLSKLLPSQKETVLPWAAVKRLLPSCGASSDRTVPSVNSVCAIC